MKLIDSLLTKYITPRNLSIALTVLYLVSLIPMLIMARYNYPSADDYSFAATSRQAWVGQNNIIAVIGEAAQKAVTEYFEWTGCFASTFLMALQPAIFGEQWYSLTTVILILMLSGSTCYLFRVILVKGLRIDPVLVHSISMITLLVLVQTMVGRREAFYWYNGAVHYLVMHSFAAFFLARLISAIITSDDKKNRRKLFMTSILGILVGGGNYMTALLLGIILSLIFFYFFYQKIIFRQKPICSQKLNYQKKWQQYIYLLIPVIFFLTAFVINIVAPGNRVRSDGASGMNPIKSIMVSFHYVLEYALSEWTGWVVILMVVTLIPLFWKAAGQTTYKFSNPLIIVVISLGLLAATITPPLYAMGNIGAGRLQALIYTVYILLLVLNTGYLTGWLRKRFYDREDQTVKTRQWSPATAKTLFWGGVFLVFGVVLSVIPDPHYFTSSSAFTDLSNGRAAIYRLALTERADQLNRAKEGEELILEPLPEAPRLLLTEDISADKDNWLNRAMAEYYRVKTVGME